MGKSKKNNKPQSSHLAPALVICVLTIFSVFLFFLLYQKSVDEKKITLPTPIHEIIKPPQKGAFLGVSLSDSNYGNLIALEEKTNKHFAIIGIYQAWGDKNNQFNKETASKITEHRSIPLITWEPWVQISGYDRSEYKVDQKEYRLKNIIDGKYDKYIISYAESIKEFKKPVMIRFAHEMNGNWYPWSSSFNTPDEYISAWRHVHDIFTKVGTTNVTWVWSPNEGFPSEVVPYSNEITKFYPGDRYVDWVGFSAFNWAGRYKNNFWRTPEDLYTDSIKTLGTLKKPIMITETASADSGNSRRKAEWIKSLAQYAKNNPSVKGIVWFNAIDNGINWKIDSTLVSSKLFENSFDDYFIQFVR